MGEKESAQIMTKYLCDLGIQAQVINIEEIIVTDDNFGNANIIYKLSEKCTGKLTSLEKFLLYLALLGKQKWANNDTRPWRYRHYSLFYRCAIKAKNNSLERCRWCILC